MRGELRKIPLFESSVPTRTGFNFLILRNHATYEEPATWKVAAMLRVMTRMSGT